MNFTTYNFSHSTTDMLWVEKDVHEMWKQWSIIKIKTFLLMILKWNHTGKKTCHTGWQSCRKVMWFVIKILDMHNVKLMRWLSFVALSSSFAERYIRTVEVRVLLPTLIVQSSCPSKYVLAPALWLKHKSRVHHVWALAWRLENWAHNRKAASLILRVNWLKSWLNCF